MTKLQLVGKTSDEIRKNNNFKRRIDKFKIFSRLKKGIHAHEKATLLKEKLKQFILPCE